MVIIKTAFYCVLLEHEYNGFRFRWSALNDLKEISSVQAKLSPKGVLNIMPLKLHTIEKAQGQNTSEC